MKVLQPSTVKILEVGENNPRNKIRYSIIPIISPSFSHTRSNLQYQCIIDLLKQKRTTKKKALF